MAIEPFRQKVGVPDAPKPVQQTDGTLLDLGPSIEKIGQQALAVMEPRLKDQVVKQGTADALAQPLGKDRDGNYMLPETPRGGVVYAAAFDHAAYNQYLLHVQDDGETRLNAIYSDPANIGKTPAEKRAMGQAVLDGMIQGAAPQARGQLFESLSRELRQRDLAESNLHYRQQYALQEKTFTEARERSEQLAGDAYAAGNPAEGLRNFKDAVDANDNLIRIGVASLESRQAMLDRMGSWRGYGAVKHAWQDRLDGLTSTENDNLADMLEGNVPTGMKVMGFDAEGLRQLIPDARVRARLAQDIRSRTDVLLKGEVAREKQDALNNALAQVPVGQGFPDTWSDEEKRKGWMGWAQQTGNDYRTPDGARAAFRRFGRVPSGVYENTFAQANARTAPEAEQLYQLHHALTTMIGKDGQTIDVAQGVMKPEDSAYMHHYANAREFGNLSPAEAYQQAQAAVAKGLKVDPKEVTSFLREVSQLDVKLGKDSLGDKLDDYLPVKWAEMNAAARDGISLDAAQQIALGVPWQKAFENAGKRFSQHWSQDPLSLDFARSKGTAWVRNAEVVPKALDMVTNKQGQGWAVHAIEVGLDSFLGDQVIPGIPKRDKLKAGVNVFARAAGRTDEKGNQLFNVIYYDPQAAGMATLIGKDGAPIVLNLGKAAKGQQAWAHNARESYQESLDAIAAANAKVAGVSRVDQFVSGFAYGLTGQAPDLSVKGSDADIAHLRELQRVHDEVFAVIEDQQFGLVRGEGSVERLDAQPRKPEHAGPLTIERYMPVTKEAIAPPAAETAQISYSKTANDWPDVARVVASHFSLSPRDVAMVFGYETGGTFSPKKRGGDTGHRLGLIQFGESERAQYGKMANGKPIDDNSSPKEWAGAIIAYLTDRGFKPGMGLLDLYSTVNAGKPGRYEASDSKPGAHERMTVRSHVARMQRTMAGPSDRWLGN